MEPPYSKREMDEKLDRIEEKLDGLHLKADYTNGKVKRIILALGMLGAFSVGLGLKELAPILKLFI